MSFCFQSLAYKIHNLLATHYIPVINRCISDKRWHHDYHKYVRYFTEDVIWLHYNPLTWRSMPEHRDFTVLTLRSTPCLLLLKRRIIFTIKGRNDVEAVVRFTVLVSDIVKGVGAVWSGCDNDRHSIKFQNPGKAKMAAVTHFNLLNTLFTRIT